MTKRSPMAARARARRQAAAVDNLAALTELYRILDFGPVPDRDKAAPEVSGVMQFACATGRAGGDAEFNTRFAQWCHDYPAEAVRWAKPTVELPGLLGAIWSAHMVQG